MAWNSWSVEPGRNEWAWLSLFTNVLQTLIANCGPIMTDKVHPERWLLASECLLAQGFPVLPGTFSDTKCLDQNSGVQVSEHCVQQLEWFGYSYSYICF